MTRLPGVCLTVTMCLALGACGDSSDSESPKADAGKASGLGVKRFAALDRVYVAAVPLDKYEDQEDVSFDRLSADSKPLLEACEALPASDALMRRLRASCPLITEYLEQGASFADCDGTATCQRALRGFRDAVKRLLDVGRRGDRAVAAEPGLAQECKQALTTPPKTYPVFEDFDSALVLLERSLRSPSPDALERAETALAAADKESGALPDGKQELERFRSGCD